MNGITMAVDALAQEGAEMRRAILFGAAVALTEVMTRDGPVLVAKLDSSQEMDLLPPLAASGWPERRKKKCEKCHRWTGGADHYCKRGQR